MNTQTQEALKMAIATMEAANIIIKTKHIDESIQVCKEALEQPAQEQSKADFDVMAYGQSFMLDGKHIPLSDVYTQQAQEPLSDHEQFMNEARKSFGIAPSWQGLSDDEIYDISICEQISPDRLWHIYVAIEQALKEKNT